jgi:hypothetical protein
MTVDIGIKSVYSHYMNMKYTVEDLVSSAKRYATMSEWKRCEPSKHTCAYRRGILPEIKVFLAHSPVGSVSVYSKEFLIADARRYSTRLEWKQAGKELIKQGKVSPYNAAIKYGKEFYSTYCPHMEVRHRWTDDEIATVALQYQHKGDWKRSPNSRHSAAYQVALTRPYLFDKATTHMVPKASPYSGDYVIYVFEFSDRAAYVGLTFRPEHRYAQHLMKGPVFERIKVCPDYAHKILASGIDDPLLVIEAEKQWIEKYRTEGWNVLNTSDGGSLGTVEIKWTKEEVIAEAQKYSTKQDWIDGSQRSYRLARLEGWFEEAAAHMPDRVLGVGLGLKRTDEAKEKMRQAKLGKPQTPEARAARSAAIKKWWAARRLSSETCHKSTGTDQTSRNIASTPVCE